MSELQRERCLAHPDLSEGSTLNSGSTSRNFNENLPSSETNRDHYQKKLQLSSSPIWRPPLYPISARDSPASPRTVPVLVAQRISIFRTEKSAKLSKKSKMLNIQTALTSWIFGVIRNPWNLESRARHDRLHPYQPEIAVFSATGMWNSQNSFLKN